MDGKPVRRKIYRDNEGDEYIFPYGKYSMAAIAY